MLAVEDEAFFKLNRYARIHVFNTIAPYQLIFIYVTISPFLKISENELIVTYVTIRACFMYLLMLFPVAKNCVVDQTQGKYHFA